MARPVPTPAPGEEAAEVITPLQKILVGSFLLSLMSVPVFAFVMYLLPFYKAPDALYRGTYFVFGIFLAVALSAAFSWFWLTKLPALVERRQTRRDEAAALLRTARREENRKAREVASAAAAATAIAARDASEEE